MKTDKAVKIPNIPVVDLDKDTEILKHFPPIHKWSDDIMATELLTGDEVTYCYFSELPASNRFGLYQSGKELEHSKEVYWKIASLYNVETVLTKLSKKTNIKNLAIQGIIVGPGIKENEYNQAHPSFYIINCYDGDALKFLNIDEPDLWGAKEAAFYSTVRNYSIQFVPEFTINKTANYDNLVTLASGKSKINFYTDRSGVVFSYTKTDGQIYRFKIKNKERSDNELLSLVNSIKGVC